MQIDNGTVQAIRIQVPEAKQRTQDVGINRFPIIRDYICHSMLHTV